MRTGLWLHQSGEPLCDLKNPLSSERTIKIGSRWWSMAWSVCCKNLATKANEGSAIPPSKFQQSLSLSEEKDFMGDRE